MYHTFPIPNWFHYAEKTLQLRSILLKLYHIRTRLGLFLLTPLTFLFFFNERDIDTCVVLYLLHHISSLLLYHSWIQSRTQGKIMPQSTCSWCYRGTFCATQSILDNWDILSNLNSLLSMSDFLQEFRGAKQPLGIAIMQLKGSS